MRKILLIISLVAMISTSSNAQTKNSRIGIKSGPTVNWASPGSTAANNGGLGLGVNVGLVYDYYFSSNMAISSGLDMNLYRMKYMFTDYRFVDDFLEKTNISVDRRLKAANIGIPVKLKLNVGIVEPFKAYVEAGSTLSINLKDYAMDSYNFYWVSSNGEEYVDCTNQYHLMQLSMVFGLGAEYAINRNVSVFAQLTLDHATSNVFVSTLEKQTGSVIRNNFIGLEIGILY